MHIDFPEKFLLFDGIDIFISVSFVDIFRLSDFVFLIDCELRGYNRAAHLDCLSLRSKG